MLMLPKFRTPSPTAKLANKCPPSLVFTFLNKLSISSFFSHFYNKIIIIVFYTLAILASQYRRTVSSSLSRGERMSVLQLVFEQAVASMYQLKCHFNYKPEIILSRPD